MLSNYVKIALRNLKKYKAYTLINVLGLATGLACCLLILLWVTHKLSYDRFHDNADRIYRVCVDLEAGSHMRLVLSMPSLAPALLKDYPEVINAVRLDRPHSASVKYKDKLIQEKNVCYADNSLFEIFNFPLLSGDPKTALRAPHSVVISEEMAEKYFDGEDPIGKILKIDGDHDYVVTGIVQNIPWNSHFTFNMACSYETLYAQNREAMENWFHIQFYTYLLLAEHVDVTQFEGKFPVFVDTYMGTLLDSIGGSLELFLQPLTSIHLHSDIGGEIAPQSSILFVYIFSCIALFILCIACFNFINLATARSVTRMREVGLRKTLGAERRSLIFQFLGESVLYSTLALIVALLMLYIILPFFNNLFESYLRLDLFHHPAMLALFLTIALVVGVLAGAYPSFFLSSFKPMRVFRDAREGTRNARFRNALVVVQFVISITLLICTMTIYRQLDYMKHKELGFDKKHVLVIPNVNELLRRRSLQTIRQELLQLPEVIDVAGSSLVPSAGVQRGIFFPEGFSESEPQITNRLHVDPHFLPTLGINIIEGRNFSETISTDPDESLIISESAARRFGWEKSLGKRFVFRPSPGESGETVFMNVIGVIQDFHSISLRTPIEPMILYCDLDRINFICVRISPLNVTQTVESISNKWSEIDPDRPFNYFFLDDSFDRLYRSDEHLGTILLSFSLLAIFIGCLGLMGLAAFMAEKRTKEIGIRKVLGASVIGIIFSLTREFARWVLVSSIVAWPLAYILLHKWLQNFAYRARLSAWLFLLAAAVALGTAVLTVCYQSLKAATANPVNTLRYE